MLRTCHSLLQQGGYMVPATFRKQSVCKVAPNADKEFHGLYLITDMRCKCLGLVLI